MASGFLVFAILGLTLVGIPSSRGPEGLSNGLEIRVAPAPFRELRLGQIALTVHTLNPYQTSLVEESYIVTNVYSFLWSYGPTWNIEPDLAVRWNRVSLDPTIWEFWLTQNAYWVDPRVCTRDAQGRILDCARDRQVDARDVQFTFDYVKQFGTQTSFFQICVEKFVRATADPDDRFHITLEFMDSDVLGFNFAGCLPILPRHIWGGPDGVLGGGDDRSITDPNVLPIGSGPYLARLDPANPTRMLPPPPIVLDRNPLWHGPEVVGRQARPDAIVFASYTTSVGMSQDLTRGAIDLAIQPNPAEWSGYLNREGILRQIVFGTTVIEQATNVLDEDLRASFAATSGRPLERGRTNPILRDYWVVRAAIHMATDRSKMIERAWRGLAVPADTLVPIDHGWHYDYPDFSPDDGNGDGNPFDFVSDPAGGEGGVPGIPRLQEEFPDGPADGDSDGLPDALEMAKDMLHREGWLFDCDTGALDTPATPALPLCRKSVSGELVDSLRFSYHTLNTQPRWAVAAQRVVEDAAKVGIELNLMLVTPSQMFNLWFTLGYDLLLWNWVFRASEDVSVILSVQTCGETSILSGNGYCPRDSEGRWIYDELYNESLRETDPVRRRAITDRLQRMIYDFGAVNTPLYDGNLYAHHTIRWENWGDWTDLRALSPDIGNPALLGQFLVSPDNRPPDVAIPSFLAVAGHPVQFVVAATDPEGVPLLYRWDFDTASEPARAPCAPVVNCDGIPGNDDQASGPSPTFVYDTTGTHRIKVRVIEDPSAGGEWITVKEAEVTVALPFLGGPRITAIVFRPADPVDTDPAVVFAAAAVHGSGLTFEYSWDFGDGEPVAVGPVVSHRFAAPGTYIVRVEAEAASGQTVSTSTIVTVAANVPPSLVPLDLICTRVNSVVHLVAFASDPNRRDTLTYSWDFGDGTPVATGNPVTHVYATSGTFLLTVTVRDSPGGHTVATTTTVFAGCDPGPPKVTSLSANPSSTWTTLPVRFTANVSDPNGDALLWLWDFENDGVVDKEYRTPATIPGQPVVREESHLYATPGTFFARLTVADLDPVTGNPLRYVSATVRVQVDANEAPSLGTLFAVPEFPLEGQEVTFSSAAHDADGDSCEVVWDFGDGSEIRSTTGPSCGDATLMATHTYAGEGTYLATVTVSDDKGGAASQGLLVTVLSREIRVCILAPWNQLAIGQTMDLTIVAEFGEGVPLSDGVVSLAVTPGLEWIMGPTPAVTGPDGSFTARIRALAEGAQAATATVRKVPHTDGTATLSVNVLPAPRSIAMTLVSDTTEMMSYETATIRVHLADPITEEGLIGALIVAMSAVGGNFTSVEEVGPGEYIFRWDAPRVTVQTYATILVSAQVGGYADVRGRVTILVDSNKTFLGAQLFVIVVPEKFVLTSGETIGVTVFVFTLEGYVVRGSSVTLRMLVPIGTLSAVTDRLNGVYTFTYTVPVVTSATGVSIRIDTAKLTYRTGTTRLGFQIIP